MALPSVADRYSAQRSINNTLYSDFLTNFNAHPDSKQLMAVKDEVAVMRSIKSLLLTNKYERLFQPSLGSNLRNFLYEDVSRQTQSSIQNAIRETIRNYEPRANIIDVIATGYPDQNGYVVSIIFYLRNIENAVTLNIPLIRVR